MDDAQTQATTGKAKLLVVDDDRLVLATVAHGLAQAGYEVIDADNGDDAILLARQHRPDLALLDIRMQGKSGFDVAAYLRDVAHIPVMFLSAFSDAATVAKRLAAYQPTKAEGQKVSNEDSDWSLLWSLRLACRLAKQRQIDKAFELIAAFPDMLWREEGFELLSAFAAQHGHAEPLWKKYKATLLAPTEKIAIFRGLCAGPIRRR